MFMGIVIYLLVLGTLFLAGLYSLYTVYQNGVTVRMAAEEVLKNPSDSSVKKYIQTVNNVETLNSSKLFDLIRHSAQKALGMPNVSEDLKQELKNLLNQKGIYAAM